MLFTALATVAASWLDVLVAYAIHYARMDARAPRFSFPGEQAREFVDYLYLALAVQTTFGTTDVSVTHPSARRVVMGHSGLAFVFNSTLIAMIISLVIGSTDGGSGPG